MFVAVILGIIEGLTEFVPISSTGHLILAGHLLGFDGERASVFEVVIQLGAILSVVVLYRERFLKLLDFTAPKAGLVGKEGLIKMAVASLPVLVVGMVAHGAIKRHLFSPLTVAAALIVGALLMIFVERRRPPVTVSDVEQLSLRTCLGVGLFQCLALWPGMSRAASTMIGGMLLGVERKVAAEFSFLVAVPVMAAAVGYDLLKSLKLLSFGDVPLFAVGLIVSFVTALFAIKFFMRLLTSWTLVPFAFYRIGVGVLVLLFLL